MIAARFRGSPFGVGFGFGRGFGSGFGFGRGTGRAVLALGLRLKNVLSRLVH